jgi:hypothetical protein
VSVALFGAVLNMKKRQWKWCDHSLLPVLPVFVSQKEVGCEGVEWIHLAQDKDPWWALVNMLLEPSGSMKGREFLEHLRDCHCLRGALIHSTEIRNTFSRLTKLSASLLVGPCLTHSSASETEVVHSPKISVSFCQMILYLYPRRQHCS